MAYKEYTEVDGAVLTLANGERVLSIAISADGGVAATLQYAGFTNLTGAGGGNPSPLTVPKGETISENWNGAINSDGTSTLTFAGLGHYVVKTEQQ